MGVLITLLTIVLVLNCFGLLGLILIQRGKGGGLAAAFGGGGMEQAFGTRAATLAQKATAVMAVIFLALSVVLGLLHQHRHVGSISAPQTPAADSQSTDASAPSSDAPPTTELPADAPGPEAE